jgi:predicted GNAT superfamily acetyltransferase
MVSTPDAIQIRALKTIEDFMAVEELQVEVWGCSEREILPSLALIPLLEIGGVLLGAFDNRALVGFVVGFPGFAAGQPILHSDMLAVRAEYRSTGLGYRLKLEQRRLALANGVEKITWTFDPLQAANAHLNFGKLGVIADGYKVNYYGQTSSALHRAGTDRLWVTWLLHSARVEQRLSAAAHKPSKDLAVVPVLLRVGTDGEPQSTALDATQGAFKIEIPHDINSIVNTDEALARRWREATRVAFTAALAANFIVSDFFKAQQKRAGSYLLTRTN